MEIKLTLKPNIITEQWRKQVSREGYLDYTCLYAGKYTYAWNTYISNGFEFSAPEGELYYNIQFGNFNSIAENMQLYAGKNHNTKTVDTGAAQLLFQALNVSPDYNHDTFSEKGTIIIQNDVWVGQNVTIVPNVIIRNGAVIAANSHVVSDVPAYAVVGGNPARVIGYRFPEPIIQKLQSIQWWYWHTHEIVENSEYFTEDVALFCDRFLNEEAFAVRLKREFGDMIDAGRDMDAWFAFVDYYENYSSYGMILEQFLDTYMNDDSTRLILYIQDDCKCETNKIEDSMYQRLQALVDEINAEKEILCTVELKRGRRMDALKEFLKCRHYLVSRTYDAVFYTCVADLFDIDIVFGVDSYIRFHKGHNICK